MQTLIILFIIFVVATLFTSPLIIVYYIDSYIPKKKREKKLSEMKDNSQCCYNCKFHRHNAYGDDSCRRNVNGYSPITGNAIDTYEGFGFCRGRVGTDACEWEEK